MAEQAHGASAGLRGGKNIEIMQQRRHHRYDSHGVNEALNETTKDGKGLRNREIYYMQLTNVAAQNQSKPQQAHRSFQREKQLRIDQPLLTYYSHKYELPKGNQELDLANRSSDLSAVLAIQSKAQALRGSVSGDNVTPKDGAQNNAIPNQNVNTNYKNAKTLKTTVYGIKQNEIQLRLSNLDDRFDGNYSQTYEFNINAWAREYYLEANAHLMIDPKLKPIRASNSSSNATLNSTALTTRDGSSALTATTMNATHQKKNSSLDILAGITLNITEMNLAGSIPLSTLRNQAHNNTIRQSNWTTNKAEDPALTWKDPVDFIHDVQISPDHSIGNAAVSEKIHIIYLEPQSIRVFDIKYVMPGARPARPPPSAEGSATSTPPASETTPTETTSLAAHPRTKRK